MVIDSNTYYFKPLTPELFEEAVKEVFKYDIPPKREFKVITSEIGAIRFEIMMPYYDKNKARIINSYLDLYFKYHNKFLKSKQSKEEYKKKGKINRILEINKQLPRYKQLRKDNLDNAKKLFYE